jgi:pimeloyl-ACP methyl ester carboxylesterase
MQRVLLVNTAAAVACVALLGGAVPRAGAAIAYGPCPKTNQYACAHLVVPLDPGGATTGTVTLSIRRHRAAVGDATTAIVALAGGPGQPAIPFAEQFALLMGPIADTRDLIVFDQRGTGSSQALSCHLQRPRRHLTLQQTVSRCAAALGPRRAFYTTADTVADIEAIRQAGGYEKLVLYGTSYGTKVAEEYAQAHPDRVEALILDSVVAPNGPDVLNRPTFGALSRVLRQICARGACRGVTANPVADLTRLLRRIHRGPLRARAVDGQGHQRKSRITAQELLGTLLLGDFSGSLRAEFVTDVRAAALGDDSPLARTLQTLSSSEGESESEEIDGPLYYATTCEEQSFPWNRAALPARRLREAEATARALPASTFAPFTARDALALSDIPACSAWPYPPAPLPSDAAPLPAVPTLILSGADDLRTPTSGARALARLIPGAHLLVVPLTGHSVLGSDPSSCSADALQALFKGGPIKPCHAGAPPARLRPQAPPPRTLGAVAPQRGYHGLAGRTAHGVALTIADLARQLGLQIELGGAGLGAFGTSAVRTGGLHSGWARLTNSAVELHDYSLIPGLTLSGTIRPEVLELHVGGSAASHGSLRRGSRHMLVGTLGGQPVRLPASSEISAAIVGIDASTRAELQHRRPRDARLGMPGPGLGDGGPQLHPLR